MLDNLKQILVPQKAAGLEIVLQGDNKLQIRLVLLEIKNKLLQVEKKIDSIDSPEQLSAYISSDTPLSIVLNGKGILHKKLSQSTDSANAIQSILPNANAADFYMQKYLNGEKEFVSIVRKNTADELIKLFTSQGFLMASFSLGPFQANSILSLAGLVGNTLSFDGHMLTINNHSITDYKSSPALEEGTIQIDQEVVEGKFILSYAAAFSELALGHNLIGIEDIFFTEQREEIKHKKIFKLAGIGTLIFFLLILMSNFFFFDAYRKDLEKLTAEEAHYSGVLNKANLVEKEVKEKEAFLSDAGWFSASRTSYYADQIAMTVPVAIKLVSLSVNPFNEKESRAKKKNVFSTGTITISGECTRATELNPWLQKLKQIRQVYKAEIVNYTFDNKDKKGVFNIQILVND